jgi:hypothetical protein
MALTHVYRVTPLAKRPHCLDGIPSSSQKARPEADRRYLETPQPFGYWIKGTVCPPARPAELSMVCYLRLVLGEREDVSEGVYVRGA